jgi:hypothetical protein
LSIFSYSCSADKIPGNLLNQRQKKELAGQLGIILPGMTKEKVRETFGLIEPEILHTSDGQEVWHYKSPEEQNIYFINDIVEKVEYIPKNIRRHHSIIQEGKI